MEIPPMQMPEVYHDFDDKVILVTGGSGSLGKMLIRAIFRLSKPKKVIVFSRDENKHFLMRQEPEFKACKFIIGDIRDQERLLEAFYGVNVVVHTAALKQVPATEFNPFEAILTNVMGAKHIIRAAIVRHCDKVIALSTDKACSPINLYGATKLCSDKLFVNANAMTDSTIFSVVRYGNVAASSGSVLPLFVKQSKTGMITVTEKDMTRFTITLQQAIAFILNCLSIMRGGEMFIPKNPSYRIMDVVDAIGPECDVSVIGIRPGEKTHEVLVPVDEWHNVVKFDDYFVIQPPFDWWDQRGGRSLYSHGSMVPSDFSYRSDTNDIFLTVEEIRSLVETECRESRD